MDEALQTCQLALEKSPLNADIHSNLGVIQHERGAWCLAEASLRRALELAPHHAESHFSLSAVLLQQGLYEQGWKEYEWRFTHNARHPIVRELPGHALWLGPLEQPKLQELVLLHEQGLGDSFQFIRFAPLLREFAQSIVMTCPKPQMSLFAASGLVDRVVPLDADPDQFSEQAAWLPLMSVPGLLDVPEGKFAERIPFLPVDPQRRLFWQDKLSAGSDLLIALNWQGNPEHEKQHPEVDRFRLRHWHRWPHYPGFVSFRFRRVMAASSLLLAVSGIALWAAKLRLMRPGILKMLRP